jgi:hypothetical protein
VLQYLPLRSQKNLWFHTLLCGIISTFVLIAGEGEPPLTQDVRGKDIIDIFPVWEI